MIPNILHFVGLGGVQFTFIHFLAIASAWSVNRPERMFFHYDTEPVGVWWDPIKPYLSLNRVAAPREIFGNPIKHYAHQADVIRLEMLMQHGGVYLDLDVICVNPFQPLLNEQFVMGIEPDRGLCNAVVLSAPQAEFAQVWYDRYKSFNGDCWNCHSVVLPCHLSKEHPSLIKVLDEYAFFYPLWNDPDFVLWNTNKVYHAKVVTKYLRDNARAAAMALFERQPLKLERPPLSHVLHGKEWHFQRLSKSYCFHLWSQVWWERYLRCVTPDTVRASDDNFSRILRNILTPEILRLFE